MEISIFPGYSLDDQHNFHTVLDSPQQIFTVGVLLKVLSYPFFKSKIPVGNLKVLIIVSLIII